MTKKRGLFSWFGKDKNDDKSRDDELQSSSSELASSSSNTNSSADWDQLPGTPKPAKESAADWDAIAEPSVVQSIIEPPVKTPEPGTPLVSQPTELSADESEVSRDSSLPAESDQPDAFGVAQAVTDVESALPAAVDAVVGSPAALPVAEQPASFMSRLKAGLKRTRASWGGGFVALFKGKKIDDELFEELEEQLLIADVGVATTTKLIHSLTESASRGQLKDGEALYDLLRQEMASMLKTAEAPLAIEGNGPFVILMVGVNGVGKTTTIGKLAKQFQAQGKSVMLAAGDTFRAAAVEQLQVWGERNQIPVVAQHTGADSASVIYDALESAKARHVDVLIADTAGRLQNKAHLMDELKKVVRVMKKLDPNAPHEVMLTIDAGTGQNAISQAKLFDEAVGLTGITLTKLDGTAKGGVIFAVADQFKIPIRYIGVGEGIDDLRTFEADTFVEALFSQE
jgi:fused signal recognition particle receptor